MKKNDYLGYKKKYYGSLKVNHHIKWLVAIWLNILCIVIGNIQSTWAQADTSSLYDISTPSDSLSLSDSLLRYEFINYQDNRLTESDSSIFFEKLWHKWGSLQAHKNFQINIVHFGGSHIQADIYTHVVRKKLQAQFDSLTGERGWIFPFKAAETNNPSNYSVSYTGTWKGYRSSVESHEAVYGLNGITVSTRDTLASLKFIFNQNNAKVTFNKVRIFSNYSENSYDIQVGRPEKLAGVSFSKKGEYLQFRFKENMDSLELFFLKTKTDEEHDSIPFALYGMIFENNFPGFVYHSIGVNGSSFKSFERCSLFENQLAYLDPDVAIISIGTNDSFDPNFDATLYEKRYSDFIDKIKQVNPEIALILTVPNDSYFSSKKHNPNTKIIEQSIQKLAQKYQAKVWNFYQIMGGDYSAKKWRENELMKKDLVHFTRKGYELKGNLFYDALINDYFKWIEQHKHN